MSAIPGYAVIYRWRLKAGMETQFIEAWSQITQWYVAHKGALGSRLHKGPDNVWYAYAQWPSAETRAAAFTEVAVGDESHQRMREAVAESFDQIELEPIADYLVVSRNTGS